MSGSRESDFEFIVVEEEESSIDYEVEYMDEIPKKKRKYEKCDPENLELAVKAKLNGMSFREASIKYNVPKSTLENKIKGKETGKWGNYESIFTKEEERAICDWIFISADHGYPKSRDDIITVASAMRDRKLNVPISKNLLSRNWFERFMKRNPDVAVRTPQSVTRSSANVTAMDLKKFVENITRFIVKEDLEHNLLDRRRFCNLDETGYDYNPKSKKVYGKCGSKNVNIISYFNTFNIIAFHNI
jgi:hypothetical protein